MTINTLKEVREVLPGDTYTATDGPGGFYQAVATEHGYFFRLADGVLFVPKRALDVAHEMRLEALSVEEFSSR